MAHLDLGQYDEPVKLGGLQSDLDNHMHYVQQMLLAAALASMGIIAVAAVMMLRLL